VLVKSVLSAHWGMSAIVHGGRHFSHMEHPANVDHVVYADLGAKYTNIDKSYKVMQWIKSAASK
jgi:hypothetical protein